MNEEKFNKAVDKFKKNQDKSKYIVESLTTITYHVYSKETEKFLGEFTIDSSKKLPNEYANENTEVIDTNFDSWDPSRGLSVKKLTEKASEFMIKHNLDDCKFSAAHDRDGYLIGANLISYLVPKTQEELDQELEDFKLQLLAQEELKAKKIKLKEEKKKAKELKLLQKLKDKYQPGE